MRNEVQNYNKPRIRLLVVDDESHLEILLVQKFRLKIRNGEYQFFFAQNGKQALECLNQQPEIDLVITDINMPEMDGITLLRRLQKTYPRTCTMVMSAYSDDQSRTHAEQAGAVKFITKPISLKSLEETIEATILNLDLWRAGNQPTIKTQGRSGQHNQRG